MRIKTPLTFIFYQCLIILSACTPSWENQLKQNQAKWESQNITHYRMSVNLPYDFSGNGYGNLPMPLIVEVKDGNMISVVDALGEKVSFTGGGDFVYYYPNSLTVQGLFSYVYQWYLKKPPDIQVSYDPALGFPSSIFIDQLRSHAAQNSL